MTKVPKEIVIELEEEDVRKDLTSIIESMSSIRFEAINNKALSDERKEEYLHLTFRLASVMKSLATETMVNNLQFIATAMDNHEPLLFYDPVQDGYWQSTAPQFVAALERAVIHIMGDRCTSLDYKHHIAQAVKYLGAQSEEGARKDNIIGSISPLYGHVRGDARVLFNAQYINQFCQGKDFDFSGDFSLRLPNLSDIVASAVMAGRQLGYLTIQIGIDRGEYLEVEKKFPGTFPKEVEGRRLRDLFGRDANRRLIVEIPLNKAPIEPDAADYFAIVSDFLANPSLLPYVRGFRPEEIGNLLARFDYSKLKDEISKRLCKKGIKVDSSALDTNGNLEDLAARVKSILTERARYPDVFGFSVDDSVRINDLINQAGDCEEYLWAGSEGVIDKIEPSVSIQFSDVRGPTGKPRHKLEGKIWDIENKYLSLVSESENKFPDWYKRPKFAVGDIVEVTSGLADEYDLDEPDDVCPGSRGKVIGFVYTVKFTKFVDKKGGVKESDGKKDTEINQVYLDRAEPYKPSNVDDEVNRIIREGLEKILSDTKKEDKISFDFVMKGDVFGYINTQNMGGRYYKYTYFVNRNGISYAMSIICPEPKIDHKGVMALLTNDRKVLRDSFSDVVRQTNSSYAHVAEYRDARKVDEIEVIN